MFRNCLLAFISEVKLVEKFSVNGKNGIRLVFLPMKWEVIGMGFDEYFL
jgi:hypothetical protein